VDPEARLEARLMDSHRAFVMNLGSVHLLVLLGGLLWHRRDRLCRSFFVYALAVFLGDRLIVTWPERFDTARFWLFKEALYWVLKLAVATEIGLLTFARLPRARNALSALVAGLAVAALLVQLVPAAAKPGDRMAWLSVASPRGQASLLVVLLAVVLTAAQYYRAPLHPFHRSLLVGFALYLIAYTAALTLLRELGAPGYRYFLALDSTAYNATVGVWTWAAWRRAPELSPGARFLQPWAGAAW